MSLKVWWSQLSKTKKVVYASVVIILSISAIIAVRIDEGITGSAVQTSEGNSCPSQGTFQSDVEYCIELCEINHTSGCKQICEMGARVDDRLGGDKLLTGKINQFRCEICEEDCNAEDSN